MDHAVLVRKHVLRARENDNLRIRELGAENTRIQRDLHVDIVNARVIRTARRMEALGRLGLAPGLDEILLVILRVLLQGLDLAVKDARARNHARRVVKLDLDFADGIQELARGLIHRSRKVKLVAIRAALCTDNPDVLLDAVVELQANVGPHARRVLVGTSGSVLGLARDHLDLVLELRELLLCEERALRILQISVVGLEHDTNVAIRERRQRDLSRSELVLEVLIRVAIRSDVDLRVCRVNNRVKAARKRNLVLDSVELQRCDGQGKIRRPRVRKRNGHVQVARTLGKLALAFERVKLANEVIDFLASGRAQDVPRVHERVRELVANRAANRHRDIAQERIADRILPARRIGSRQDLAILDRDETGQRNLRVRLPSHIALLRELKLGRATKTRLARRRVNLDGLDRKGGMAVVDKAPKRGLRLSGIVIRQVLVRMALVANFRKHGIVSRATHGKVFICA